MITGFNTDIEYKGVTYHVQTEDKGVATPLILSLVYDRGTILASKRSPYDDLLLPAFNEKALSERLQKQHKLICAAVRAGKIEELKQMTKESASKRRDFAQANKIKSPFETNQAAPQTIENLEIKAQTKETTVTAIHPADIKSRKPETPPQILKGTYESANGLEQTARELPKIKVEEIIESKLPAEKILPPPFLIGIPDEPSATEEEPIVEAFEIIEDEPILLSAEAVEIIEDFGEAAATKLKIELPDDLTFKGGDRKTLNICVRRGNAKNGLSGAHVMIKVTGSMFRPLIFHAKTSVDGTASVHLQMPHFKGGRAALLIRAMSDGEETELRRAIEQS